MTYNPIEFENPWMGLWVILLAWAIPTVLIVVRDAMVIKSQAWHRTNAVTWLAAAVAAVLSAVISLQYIRFLIPESVTPAVAPELVHVTLIGPRELEGALVWEQRMFSTQPAFDCGALTFRQETGLDAVSRELDLPKGGGIELVVTKPGYRSIHVLVRRRAELARYSIRIRPDQVIQEPLRVGGDVSEPIEISRVKPACPHNASAGVAILEAIITADGRVEEVRVLRSHSPEGDAAAVAAVRQWRYKPAMYHGKPVAVYLTITVPLCA